MILMSQRSREGCRDPTSPYYGSEAWSFPVLQAVMEKQWVVTLVTKRNEDPEMSEPLPQLQECEAEPRGTSPPLLSCLGWFPGTQGLRSSQLSLTFP